MSKAFWKRSLLSLLIVMLFIGCGANKVEELKGRVDTLSDTFNGIIDDFMAKTLEFDKIIEENIEKQANISVVEAEKLLEENGGTYIIHTNENGESMLVNKDSSSAICNGLMSYHTLSGKKRDNALIRLAALHNAYEVIVEKTKNAEKYYGSSWCHGKDVVKPSGTPFLDLISILPPTYDYRELHWFQAGLGEAKDISWIEAPFVTLGPGGWVQTALTPIKDTSGETIEVNTYDFLPLRAADIYIKNNDDNILLVGPFGSLLGVSKVAKKVFNFKELEDYNYLEMIQDNPKMSEEFKLTHEGQDDIVKSIGEKVLDGQAEFELESNGKKYNFVVSRIKEINYYLVGFIG